MRFKRILFTLSLLCLACLPLSAAHGRTEAEPGLSLLPAWMLSGELQGDNLGAAVSLDGDYNGDGYADLVVGAFKQEQNVYREGIVYLYNGRIAIPETPDWVQGGGQQGMGFGAALASAGDVNQDNRDDLLIGAPFYKDPEGTLSNQGAVYLYRGEGFGMLTSPSWTFLGDQKEMELGGAVSPAGDLNNDGYADILVGARKYKQYYENEGLVHVFFGKPTLEVGDPGLSLTPDWTAYGGSSTAYFGQSLAALGDIDNNGYADFAVGAPGWDLSDIDKNVGRVMVFMGSASGLPLLPSWTFDGELPYAQLGYAVAGPGDVDGNGYDDLLVGAPTHGYGAGYPLPYEGKVYLFLGGEYGFASNPDWVMLGGQENANLGWSLSAAGDLNQDGLPDALVGAYQYSATNFEGGRVYAFYGASSGLQSTPSWWIDGDKSEASFGYAISGGGDFNRDGYLDMAMGAPEYKVSEIIVGRAYMYLGVPEAELPGELKYLYLPMVVKAP